MGVWTDMLADWARCLAAPDVEDTKSAAYRRIEATKTLALRAMRLKVRRESCWGYNFSGCDDFSVSNFPSSHGMLAGCRPVCMPPVERHLRSHLCMYDCRFVRAVGSQVWLLTVSAHRPEGQYCFSDCCN